MSKAFNYTATNQYSVILKDFMPLFLNNEYRNFIYLNQKGSLPKTNPSVWLTKNKLPNITMKSIVSTFLKYFLLYMLHDICCTIYM